MYEDGKQALQLAISEYDQAVFDLTASVVASRALSNVINFRRTISTDYGRKAKAR